MTTHVTARTAELPVTLAEAKDHLRYTGEELETYIQSLLEAATEYCEAQTGRSLRVSETVTQSYCSWPSCFQFDRQPVLSIESIEYYDADGDLQEFDSDNYLLHKSRNAAAHLWFVSGVTLPSLATRDDAVIVTYLAGYGSINDVPATDDDPMVLGVPAMGKVAVKLKLDLLFGNLMPQQAEQTEQRLADILRTLSPGTYR